MTLRWIVAASGEITASLRVGHWPGVVIGLGSLLFATVLKTFPNYYHGKLLGFMAPESLKKALDILTAILLVIRLVSLFPDKRYESFPHEVARPHGATRVALKNNNKDFGLRVPRFKASPESVQRVCHEWLTNQPRTTILRAEPGYIHAQALSFWVGTPDEIAIYIQRKDGKTEVWIQSEVRIGIVDMDANYYRVKHLCQHLEATLD